MTTPMNTNMQQTGLLPQAPAQQEQTAQSSSQTQGQTYTAQPSELVENRLTELLQRDNPYLARARQAGFQSSASRGLQNTTMGVEAGESAAIEHALPIAQQDASFYQSRSLQEQQGQITSGHIEQQGQIQRDVANIQGETARTVAQIQGANQLKAVELQGQIQAQLDAASDAAAERRLMLQGEIEDARLGQQHANWFEQQQWTLDNVTAPELAQRLAHEDAQNLRNEFNHWNVNFQSDMSHAWLQIMTNDDLSQSARADALEMLNASGTARWNTAMSIYNAAFNWDETIAGPPQWEPYLPVEREEDTTPNWQDSDTPPPWWQQYLDQINQGGMA